MKSTPIVLALVGCFTSGCNKLGSPDPADPGHLHWFTLGTWQQLIPLQSSEINLGEKIDSERLTGKIIRDSKGLHATLEATHGLSVGSYRNYIKPDEIFAPALYSYSGSIHATYFVVSKNPDLKLLYQELQEQKPTAPAAGNSFTIDLGIPLFVDPEPEA